MRLSRRRFVQASAIAAASSMASFSPVIGPAAAQETAYGLSLFGDLKYGPDSAHFDYVEPNAPKGGTLHLATVGTFSTLNPFTLKGVSRGGRGLPLREPARRRGGRAGRGIRADRRRGRARPRPAVCALPPAARGALARWHAGHGRRCGVLVRDSDDRGRAELRHPARRRRPSRDQRRSQRHLPPRRSRQSQAAAHRRGHANRLRGVFPGPLLRRDDVGTAARQRALPGG